MNVEVKDQCSIQSAAICGNLRPIQFKLWRQFREVIFAD